MTLMSKVTSFKKVLRQHGFYAVRGTKDRPLFSSSRCRFQAYFRKSSRAKKLLEKSGLRHDHSNDEVPESNPHSRNT